MFMQAYEQVQEMDVSTFRPPAVLVGSGDHLSFEIQFRGEHVVGETGPYRQFFTDVSTELKLVRKDEKGEGNENDGSDADDAKEDESKSRGSDQVFLDLLIASRNMQTSAARGKENFTINPLLTSQRDLSYFMFLGVLMGVCIRTNPVISVNLPTIFWKQLTGQRFNQDDLATYDDSILAQLSQLLACKSKEKFDELFEEYHFTTVLSDGKSQVELVPGGADKELTFENRYEYARKLLHVRMNEFKRQADAIKKGICQIVPEALLNMVSHAELEEWVYGKKHIDVDLLQRNTGYEGVYKEPGNKVVEWFWRALREMSQEERRQFILFCYAQPTIPANDEEFRR